MHHVLLSLAANVNHKKNLCNARKALAQILSRPAYTKEIWTEPCSVATTISSSSDSNQSKPRIRHYLNQLVSAETMLTMDQLNQRLKELELQSGRTSEMRQQGLVPLDLDLLEYDGERHHLSDWQRPYVQQLLPQIYHTTLQPSA